MVLVKQEPKKIYIWSNEVKKVYLWSTQVRPYSWEPWANTIAYYPLTASSTTNDMKGFGTAYNLTSWWTAPSFWTYGWVSCANFSASWVLYTNSWSGSMSADYTMCWWYYETWNPPYDNWVIFGTRINNVEGFMAIRAKWRPNSQYWITWVSSNPNQNIRYTSSYTASAWWQHVCITCGGSTLKLYINWEYKSSLTRYTTDTCNYILLSRYRVADSLDRSMRWYLSEVIFESKERTATEIQKYYNRKKANYWL